MKKSDIFRWIFYICYVIATILFFIFTDADTTMVIMGGIVGMLYVVAEASKVFDNLNKTKTKTVKPKVKIKTKKHIEKETQTNDSKFNPRM